MNTVIVRIPAPLRSYTRGADEVRVDGSCVADALASLSELHDGLRSRILDPEGEPRQFVNIFLGSRNVRALQGMATPVSEGDVISIVPAVAGGTS
jgi:sulfur-carrier protein